MADQPTVLEVRFPDLPISELTLERQRALEGDLATAVLLAALEGAAVGARRPEPTELVRTVGEGVTETVARVLDLVAMRVGRTIATERGIRQGADDAS